MRWLSEMIGVLLIGVASFFAMLVLAAGGLVMLVVGMLTFCTMLVGLFCAVSTVFYPTWHNAGNAAGFLGLAALGFATIFSVYYYVGRFRQDRELNQIGSMRMVDAPFNGR